jgi:short-subunit dehydrogenase
MKVRDRVVIVTGASSGIGKATAELLAAKGAQVALTARSVGKMKKMAKDMPDSFVVGADLRKRPELRAMVRRVFAHYGRIDILMNIAGQGMRAPVRYTHVDDFHKLIALNLYAPLLTMQAVIPIMEKQGSGVIVNISSEITMGIYPPYAAYAATKSALTTISKAARVELGGAGIEVITVYPDLTATNFHKNLIPSRVRFEGEEEEEFDLSQADPPEKVANAIVEAVERGLAERTL